MSKRHTSVQVRRKNPWKRLRDRRPCHTAEAFACLKRVRLLPRFHPKTGELMDGSPFIHPIPFLEDTIVLQPNSNADQVPCFVMPMIGMTKRGIVIRARLLGPDQVIVQLKDGALHRGYLWIIR